MQRISSILMLLRSSWRSRDLNQPEIPSLRTIVASTIEQGTTLSIALDFERVLRLVRTTFAQRQQA